MMGNSWLTSERIFVASAVNTDEPEVSDGSPSTFSVPELPSSPESLLDPMYAETLHPDAAAAGHRPLVHPETGVTNRFDEGEEGRPGHAGRDHYHVEKTNATGRHDQYLDKDGNPVANGSNASHRYPDY